MPNQFIMYPDGGHNRVLIIYDKTYFGIVHCLMYNKHLTERPALKESTDNNRELVQNRPVHRL